MKTLAVDLIFFVYFAVSWWFRGGKLGQIVREQFDVELGTTQTRLACAYAMSVPLLALPYGGLCFPLFFGATTIGYFKESMGVQNWREVLWMSLWGLVVCCIMCLMGSPTLWPLLGLLVGPIYLVNRLIGNDRFLDWTERAELLTGGTFGLAVAKSLI